jgi:hypothetical protein
MASAGFEVQKKPCATCIYRPDTGFDIKKLEREIADAMMRVRRRQVRNEGATDRVPGTNKRFS